MSNFRGDFSPLVTGLRCTGLLFMQCESPRRNEIEVGRSSAADRAIPVLKYKYFTNTLNHEHHNNNDCR